MIKKNNKLSFNINDDIFSKGGTVRIIGDDIESQVVSLEEAKQMAYNKGLDLIEVNSKTYPIIVKIADYSKFLFEQKKLLKKNKQKTSSLKEIQLSTNISTNDLSIKAKKAKEFIADGDKVKVVLTMKGRELGRKEDSKKSLYQFILLMEDVAVAESMPKDDKNKSIVILRKK